MKAKNYETNTKWTCHDIEELRPVKLIQVNIYQSHSYRKEVSWLNFDYEPRVPGRQQVKINSPT